MSPRDIPIAGPHVVRYGTAADQKFLLDEFLDSYDELVINATMVAHMPAALASFLMTRALNKPYFIDPQTHGFQHDVTHLESSSESRAGEIKRSVQKLLDAYGEPVKTVVGERHESLVPSDLLDHPRRLAGFCQRVVRFQEEAITGEADASDSSKYYDYLKKKGKLAVGGFGPSVAVAPYFYMTAETVDDWLKVNTACAAHCKDLRTQAPLAVQVVIASELLTDRDQRSKLIREYTSSKVAPDLFLVWIDDFVEQEASEAELRGFVSLILGLGKVAPVVNLYGGFLSVALSYCGVLEALVGVAHGLEYGESRGVVPIGGGVPVAKFYFPPLHMRLPSRQAVRAVRAVGGMASADEFHDKVCDCAECRKVIVKDPPKDFAEYGRTKPVAFTRRGIPTVMEYPLPETRNHSVRHYMWCKAKEYRDRRSLREVIKELSEARKLGRVPGLETVSHCRVWERVLTPLPKK